MNYKIRTATERDFGAIMEMVRELAEFEKASESVLNSISQMKREQSYFRALVAQTDDGEIIAMAVYFFAYYTWVGKSLYLDDLYVKEAFRSQGVGSALLKEIIKIAQKEDCKRIRWQVLNWNKRAVKVYRSIGAAIDDRWSNCDISYEQIKAFKV